MLFCFESESPQVTQDSCKCTLASFTADPFHSDEFFWLPVEGLNEAIEAYDFIT